MGDASLFPQSVRCGWKGGDETWATKPARQNLRIAGPNGQLPELGWGAGEEGGEIRRLGCPGLSTLLPKWLCGRICRPRWVKFE